MPQVKLSVKTPTSKSLRTRYFSLSLSLERSRSLIVAANKIVFYPFAKRKCCISLTPNAYTLATHKLVHQSSVSVFLRCPRIFSLGLPPNAP